jgi:hypothetical protein
VPNAYAAPLYRPLDQADGLRRLFATRASCVLALVANPHGVHASAVLDRVATGLASVGRQVLVVDAAACAPPPPELVQLDLAPCFEEIAPRVAYLPARHLPLRYVDTRGCAASFIAALQAARPQADAIVLHAEPLDLARVLKYRAARPLLLAADEPESLKHAYASCKLLAQRCGLMTYDLLLAAPHHSSRLVPIARSLSGCADRFLGAVLRNSALVDPALPADTEPDPPLLHLLQEQLRFGPVLQEHTAAAPTATAHESIFSASVNPASSRTAPQALAAQAWAPVLAEPSPFHTAY